MGEQSERYDLVIIGSGAAGVMAARLAASLDLRVAMVERAPSGARRARPGVIALPALIESARTAHLIRHANDLGLHVPDVPLDTSAVWARVTAVSADAWRDEVDALIAIGVDHFFDDAVITGPHEVTVTSNVLSTRFVLVCTDSRPRWPDIAGLDDNVAVTADTFWSLPHLPRSVVFIGGGSASLELAQALSRLGVGCTVLERERRVLHRNEPGLVHQLVDHLRADGVEIITSVNITRVRRSGPLTEITGAIDGVPHRWGGEVAVVATGRVPDIDGLGLAEVGVVIGPHGAVADERGRTAVRSVYAIDGAARHLAARAVRDMCFPGRASTETFASSVTFTDPELASTGLTVVEAEAVHGDEVDVWRCDLNPGLGDRMASRSGGEAILVATRGRVVGAHVLGRGASEVIGELALASGHDMKLSDLAHIVHPAPTVSSAIGQLAVDSSFELAKKLNWLVRKAR